MNVRALIRVTALLAMATLCGCGDIFTKKRGGASATDLDGGYNAGKTDLQDALINVQDDASGAYGLPFDQDPSRQLLSNVTLDPIRFTFDSYLVPANEMPKVQAAANYLLGNPGHVMIIEGHCDERGSNEYNLSLSEQRALDVKTKMVIFGVAENRLQTRAYGEEHPAVSGSGEEAWRLNRRGEFKAYK